MRRQDLEHIIRAASTIADDDEIIIIGSQAILGQFPDSPAELLPAGWQERLVPIRNENTRQATGWCLEVHDLLVSKYVANRPKDRRFSRAGIAAGMVNRAELEARLAATTLDGELRSLITELVAVDFAQART